MKPALLLSLLAAAAALIPFTASAQAPQSVLIPGNAWLGGQGVDVHWNAGDCCGSWGDSYTYCPTSGTTVYTLWKWQCDELGNRLYAARGWYCGPFLKGDGTVLDWAHEMYDGAPLMGMEAHANGSGYVPVPGDCILWWPSCGNMVTHLAVVDYVDAGHVYVCEQNMNSSGRATLNRSGVNGSSLVRSDGTGCVRGVVHSPNNNLCDNKTQGAIRTKYYSLGGCGSFLGAPTTTEQTTPNGQGKYNHFANNGSIYWTSANGAWEIHGSIRDKWAALGWETSALGFPTSDERGTPAGGGRYNSFQNGGIYWTSALGAHNVQGEIYNKWAALNWEAGPLGFPTTDEGAAANGGRYNHFQNGSIYWSTTTGAHAVQGAIKTKWASMGYENSCHGYPTSDEYDWNGGKRTDFQNGTYITWTSAGGAVSSCEVAKVNVILDNSAAGFTVTGAWSTGTSATDKYGSNYRYRSTAAVSQPAQWAASLSAAGSYVVSAWWAQGSNRSATAPYTVYHSTGSTTVNKSQKVNGGSWQSLGTFNLNSGTNTVRLSCWTTTGFIVVADAIRWQQQ